MDTITAFNENRDLYEKWFSDNGALFKTELAALSRVLPEGRGLEVGVGTGLFAFALGIGEGVEPSEGMAKLARDRGIHVTHGFSENLPYPDEAFDFALMVTVLCFVKDPLASIREMKRVVRKGGKVIIAFLDRNTETGALYDTLKVSDPFYKHASFRSADEVLSFVKEAGLDIAETLQTVIGDPSTIIEPQLPEKGLGKGLFGVIAASVR